MIARPFRRTGPVPFANSTLQALMQSTGLPQAWITSQDHGSNGKGNGNTPPASRSPAPAARHGGPTPHRGRDMRATFHGHGVLSVRSSTTGALYRFDGHGASLAIDPRDALLLARLSDVHVD